jgi:peptide-methionine (R)-S-oxide reductase
MTEEKVSIDLPNEIEKVEKTEDEWKSELSELEYYVIREKGTERSFTGDLWDNKEEGIYTCRACQLPLFTSTTKFKSGTGWPSYYQPIRKEYIKEDTDHLLGYPRTEVLCARCDGHLGHVFSDGPEPTGLRYCINSVSLDFIKEEADNN